MYLPTRSHCAGLALCASLLALICQPVRSADISGSIRFSDENFSVDVRTVGKSLSLIARGCNNFDLTVATQARDSGLVLRNANGADLRAIGNGKFIEARTCEAERYSTDFMFGAPATTKWIPQAEAVPGDKRIKYAATLAPTQIRFDPPVTLTIFDKNTKARPIKVSGVAQIATRADTSVVYSSDAIHFLTAGGTIHRSGGFAPMDEFSLASGSQRFSIPAVKQGSEITFNAPADGATRFGVYYPADGPHVLAFYGDDRQTKPTSVSSLRVDGRGLLTPEFAILRAGPIVVERGFWHFVYPREQIATNSLDLNIGSSGVEVRDVRVASSDGGVLDFKQLASGRYEPAVNFTSVPGAVPLSLLFRVRVPKTWDPGEHTITVTVSGEGELRREIPMTIKVEDPYRTARVVMLTVLAAILAALVLWTLLKRQRVKSQEADARVLFYQQNEAEYVRVRERIEVLLASETDWREVDELLEQFDARRLQTALTPQQWNSICKLAEQQKSREVLEALERALARFVA